MSAFSPTVFSGKRFAVVGLGKNGLPVALGLRSMGADVVAWDDNPAARQAALDAMEILRKQGRIISADSIGPVAPFDQLVLAAVYMLHGEGDVVNITDKVSEMSGREVLLDSSFASLDRLEKSYLISGRESDPKTEPDGESRRYFTMTLVGEKVLVRERETSKLLNDLLGDFA